MFTRCPACETVFRVSPAALRSAAGRVRCGQCAEVFDALQTLSDDPRQVPLPASPPAAAAAVTANTETGTVTPDRDESATAPSSLADRLLSQQAAPTEFAAASDARDAQPAAQDTAAGDADLLEPETPPSRDFEPVNLDFDPGELEDFDASDSAPRDGSQADTARDEPVGSASEAADLETVLTAAQEVRTESDAPAADAADGGAQEPAEDEIILQGGVPESDDESPDNAASAAPADAEPARAEAALLLEETEPSGGAGRVFGALIALLLLVLLAGQWAYVQRVPLYEQAALRPWLERFCEALQCTLPLQRAPQRIEVVDRMVREHPRVPDALSVELAFVNRAAQTIAYPVVELRLSDMTGKQVVARRFAPSEYLPADVPIAQGLAPDRPVQVSLEVVTPSAFDVVSFQFEFF